MEAEKSIDKLLRLLYDSLSNELGKVTKTGVSKVVAGIIDGVKSIFTSIVGLISSITNVFNVIAGNVIMLTILLVAVLILVLVTIAYLILQMVYLCRQMSS